MSIKIKGIEFVSLERKVDPYGTGIAVQEICDGMSTPNPGLMKVIRHDGTQFIKQPQVAGTNHRAVYAAVKAALDDAVLARADYVEIGVYPKNIFEQFSEGKVFKLRNFYEEIMQRAKKLPSMKMILIEEPLVLPQGVVTNAHELRRLAP